MFKLYRLISFFLLLGVSAASFAIVNIEKVNIDEVIKPFEGEFNFDISGASGNSDIQSSTFGSRLQWNETSTQFVVLKYNYEESLGVKSSDKTFFHYRFIKSIKDPVSWETFFQLENDEFKLLKLRALYGAGAVVRFFIDDSKQQAKLGLGLFYSREEYLANTLLTIEELVRANIYFTYQYSVNKNISFLSTTYFQPNVENDSDNRALEQLSFEFNMTTAFLYFITLDISYDNDPLPNLDSEDISYKSGIKYRF